MIVLGKVNKNKAREKDKDGLEMLTKKCQPYESKEELFKQEKAPKVKEVVSPKKQIIDTKKECVSDNNEVYDLFVRKEELLRQSENKVEEFRSNIYSDGKKEISRDRVKKISKIYSDMEKLGLGSSDILKVIRQCLTLDDMFSLTECAYIDEEYGEEEAYKYLGKTRR